MFTPSQSFGKQAIFLLEIDFMGQIYRFAEQKINIGNYSYNSELRDYSYTEQSDLIGVNVEANSISCSVVFDGVDLIRQWRKGQSLDGCKAELSYVLEQNGTIETEYEQREVVFIGTINQPVIGDPAEPLGFASFSIEQNPFDLSNTFLNSEQCISAKTFAYHDAETAGGKAYPFVFGQPGNPRDAENVTVETFATPAYMSRKQAGNYHMLIAGHPVEATQVKIRDEAGNVATFAVVEAVDAKGNAYSYCDVTGSSIVYPGKVLGSAGENAKVSEWWVNWSNGGGFKNPFGDGVLIGGGDVCRYALLLTKQDIDWGAWGNASVLLNAYKFEGYINDLEVGAWDWLNSNILPFLPVEIVAGIKGIRPVLALVFASTYLQASSKIIANASFFQTGPITTAEPIGELVNKISILFAKDGFSQDYSMIARVGGEKTDLSWEHSQEQTSEVFSLISANKFGILQKTIESDYVYDRDTSFRIARTLVKAKSFPFLQIEYTASIEFGYLRVGDLIQITDDNLYLEACFATILQKSFTSGMWNYIIGIQNNAIALQRNYGS